MSNFFYEKPEIIKESLLTEQAKNWALSFINPEKAKERWQKNPKLNSAQLRKYYHEVKSLEARVEAEGFEKMKPMIKMLKSKVAYACPSDGRDRKIPMEFRRYIETMVDHVEKKEDFMAFAKCFEAVVGYFYGEGGR
ncbi:MAG: type III-A CRISPR-associated protein Csm2 [candidate division KSB1 bacterium]|nr:type III-A CRISPR-associated protein Csm2 [candidate division KSB1 bacterium]